MLLISVSSVFITDINTPTRSRILFVSGVLLQSGFVAASEAEEADVIMANTCAIRENAEAKVWQRLSYFRSLKNKNRISKVKPSGFPLVGVLGCMVCSQSVSQLVNE